MVLRAVDAESLGLSQSLYQGLEHIQEGGLWLRGQLRAAGLIMSKPATFQSKLVQQASPTLSHFETLNNTTAKLIFYMIALRTNKTCRSNKFLKIEERHCGKIFK